MMMGDPIDKELEESEFKCDEGGNSGAKTKDLVHKCNSDPGGITSSRSSPTVRSFKYPSGGVTRKCVLTLDGYSYVIGKVTSSPHKTPTKLTST